MYQIECMKECQKKIIKIDARKSAGENVRTCATWNAGKNVRIDARKTTK
jgi:hypothetical protein